MTTIANVSKLAGAIVAGAMLLGWSNAEACSLASWTSSTGSPAVGGPTDSTPIQRYSGVCGMKPGTNNSYVVESAQHQAEGGASPFRGRFFYFTGFPTGASPVVFRALDANSGGNNVIDVVYDATEQNFDFTVNGATRSTPAGSAPRNRWIGVSFVYQANQAFTAETTNMATTSAAASGLTAGAATVEAVQLGVVANGVGGSNPFVDEYEASRAASATGAFTARIRGDATGDAVCNSNDISSAANDILFTLIGTGAMAPGQPDCTVDGQVNSDDISCIANRILDDLLGITPCN